MTFTLSHFQFQIYYSQEFKLYDLVVYKNDTFHSHYHLSSKKEINKIINFHLEDLQN
jgi:hypothetical protein